MDMRDFYRQVNRLQRSARSLMPRPSFTDFIAPAIGLVTVGLVAGAGIALFFTPMTGKKLRDAVNDKINTTKTRVLAQAGSVASNVTSTSSVDNGALGLHRPIAPNNHGSITR